MVNLPRTGPAKMGHLESRTMGLVGATLACVPGLSPFFVVGIPCGIWSLRPLNDIEVQTAFQVAQAAKRQFTLNPPLPAGLVNARQFVPCLPFAWIDLG